MANCVRIGAAEYADLAASIAGWSDGCTVTIFGAHPATNLDLVGMRDWADVTIVNAYAGALNTVNVLAAQPGSGLVIQGGAQRLKLHGAAWDIRAGKSLLADSNVWFDVTDVRGSGHSAFHSGYGTSGGMLLVGCTLTGVAGAAGTDWFSNDVHATATGCTITGNALLYPGSSGGNITIRRCTATMYDGMDLALGSVTIRIAECVILATRYGIYLHGATTNALTVIGNVIVAGMQEIKVVGGSVAIWQHHNNWHAVIDGLGPTNWTNNGYTTLASGDAGTDNVVTGAPGFVGGGDYHLVAGSPLINRGCSTAGESFDRDGVSIPQGTDPCIGAYEFIPQHCGVSGVAQMDSTHCDVTFASVGGGTAMPLQVSAETAGNWDAATDGVPGLAITGSVKQAANRYRLVFNRIVNAEHVTVTALHTMVSDQGGNCDNPTGEAAFDALNLNAAIVSIVQTGPGRAIVTFESSGGGSAVPLEASAIVGSNWLVGGVGLTITSAAKLDALTYGVIFRGNVHTGESVTVSAPGVVTDQGGSCTGSAGFVGESTDCGVVSVAQDATEPWKCVVIFASGYWGAAPDPTSATDEGNWGASGGLSVVAVTRTSALIYHVEFGDSPGTGVDVVVDASGVATDLGGTCSDPGTGGFTAIPINCQVVSVAFHSPGRATVTFAVEPAGGMAMPLQASAETAGSYGVATTGPALAVTGATRLANYIYQVFFDRPLNDEHVTLDASAVATDLRGTCGVPTGVADRVIGRTAEVSSDDQRWLDENAPVWKFKGVIPTPTDLPQIPIYQMLQEGLRQIDEKYGRSFLERYLERMQQQVDRLALKLWRLPLLNSMDHTPDVLLPNLLALVGFGPGSGAPGQIAARMDPANQRRLIKVAMLFWKRRGRKDALSDMLRSLACGVRPAIDDWFYLRALADEALLGHEGGPGGDLWLLDDDPAEILAGTADGPTAVSIRVPDLDGNLDRQTIMDLCDLARSIGARYEVAFVAWVDTFLDGRLVYWLPRGSTAAQWQAGDSTVDPPVLPGLVLIAGCRERVDTPRSAAWTKYHVETLIRWVAPATVDLRFYVQDDLNCYLVRLDPPTAISVIKVVAGVETVLQTVVVDMPVPAVWGMGLDVVHEGVGDNTIRVYLDGDVVIEYTGSSTYRSGSVEFACTSGQVVLHRSEVWETPLDLRVLEPG